VMVTANDDNHDVSVMKTAVQMSLNAFNAVTQSATTPRGDKSQCSIM